MIVQCETFSKNLNPRNIDKTVSNIRFRNRFPYESSFWISVSACKHTILPDIQPANRIVIISASNPAQGCHFGEFVARFRKSCEFWKRLATNILVWRFGEFLAIFESIWPQILWFGEMYDLYICTYLLTYSYVDLLFLSLLMVWKFMTSNESAKVLKVEAWDWTLLIKYVCKMFKQIL